MIFKVLLAAVSLTCGQVTVEVKRGDLQVRIPVSGTVVVAETVRLKSAIDGRVEDILVSTYAWAAQGQPVGHLANKEMAAILDSHTTTEEAVVKARWRDVYAPTPILCPWPCFIMRRFVSPKEWVKPKAVLFEAARLNLVGRVRPEDTLWVKDGQPIEFWAKDNPIKKLKGYVTNYVLDFQGQKFDPGGTVVVALGPERSLDPGAEWEGAIVPTTKKNVLMVPTDALIRHGGSVFLPVKVSTGITTSALTEITAGVDNGRAILVLDDARLRGAPRHRGEVDTGAINRRIQEEYLKDLPRPPRVKPLPDPDAVYGEDPYAE